MDADIVDRLRKLAAEFPTLDGIMDSEWTNAAAEIETLRAERDAARLEVCLLRCQRTDSAEAMDAEIIAYAESRGWNSVYASTETPTDSAKRAETDTDDGA